MTEQTIKTPLLPESVSEATVAAIKVKEGDCVQEGDVLFELETDKVMLEVTAPEHAKVTRVNVKEGDSVKSNDVMATHDPELYESSKPEPKSVPTEEKQNDAPSQSTQTHQQGPAIRSILNEINQPELASASGSGKGGRLTKDDVTRMSQDNAERVPMSPLRKTIAKRLVEAQQSSAMLTTFNEVNMKPVMDLRSKHKEAFEKKHGVRLGFMSFFVTACCHALREFPDVNAAIDGSDLVYHKHQNIGIAVSAPRGLMVPVIQQCQDLSMADIELNIKAYAEKARTNKLALEEMQGGTFTITNGGVFGSMLSTPILNPPQSAILGMHNITERVVVEAGEMVIRPMIYLALSYDHRIIDGSTSVQFLVAIKQHLEDPSRILLDL